MLVHTRCLYKVLTADGHSPYQSEAVWSLPRREGNRWVPGDWQEVRGPLVLGERGFHLTTWRGVWDQWYTDFAMTVWSVEVDGPIAQRDTQGVCDPLAWLVENHVVAARRVRLLEPVTLPYFAHAPKQVLAAVIPAWRDVDRLDEPDDVLARRLGCPIGEQKLLSYYAILGRRGIVRAVWDSLSNALPSELLVTVAMQLALRAGLNGDIHVARYDDLADIVDVDALIDAVIQQPRRFLDAAWRRRIVEEYADTMGAR